jgi:hypothetical protein
MLPPSILALPDMPGRIWPVGFGRSIATDMPRVFGSKAAARRETLAEHFLPGNASISSSAMVRGTRGMRLCANTSIAADPRQPRPGGVGVRVGQARNRSGDSRPARLQKGDPDPGRAVRVAGASRTPRALSTLRLDAHADPEAGGLPAAGVVSASDSGCGMHQRSACPRRAIWRSRRRCRAW